MTRSKLGIFTRAAWAGCLVVAAAAPLAAGSFTTFESGQVRPLAMSPDGRFLYAVNTPDNRLEVFRIRHDGLEHRTSVTVGLEPVAVAARRDGEVWVVNHLSDSVSVVELNPAGTSGRVVRTLLVGDEPRDLVFAGPDRDRAFVTTAHRGQNSPIDPQLITPGVGRADVWVFDAEDLGDSLGGDPRTIVTLFADTPRSLAASPDGRRVYAAAFHSGNRTATVADFNVPDGFEPAGGVPGPSTNFEGAPAPEVGLIVRDEGGVWIDELGRDWTGQMRFNLPDLDVFVIAADADPPAQVAGAAGAYRGVGTILYDLAVNPVSGKVYVANTEAVNLASFEGPGTFAGRSLRGHLHENRVTVLDGAAVLPRHLNKHVDYGTCCAPIPNPENERSLALPMGMAVSADGEWLYLAAMGSDRIGVFRTGELEDDSFVPDPVAQIPLTGGGPTGVVLDEARGRLYALTRFDDGISTVDLGTRREVGHVTLHNPEPASVTRGRRLLYDARSTSSHGDSACASCHVFGDFDSLAWNLGNPDAPVIDHPGPFATDLVDPTTGIPVPALFHPMKGPMVTQSLRGMANHGPMHWRGDRTGGNDAPTAQPDGGSFDERAAFAKFQAGFVDLLGRPEPIPSHDMEAFTDFILQVVYPPNPIRALDNSLTPNQAVGKDFFFSNQSCFQVDQGPCVTCHAFDAGANPGTPAPGFFGADGASAFDFEPQLFKVPHFRNLYQKVGRFGQPEGDAFFPPADHGHKGDQVRGVGFLHEGAFDTVFRFISVAGFSDLLNAGGFPFGPAGDPLRRQVEDFLLAFDTGLAPAVGQQVTHHRRNSATAGARIDLLAGRARQGECDLVAKAQILGKERGFLALADGRFRTDLRALPPVPGFVLRALAELPGVEVTYTCVPPGSGTRIGIDRDADGVLDGDE